MVLLAHPTGNANVRQAAQALEEAGLLAEFWTALYWNPDCWLARLLPATLKSELARRAFPHVPRHRLRTVPLREMGRLFSGLVGLGSLAHRRSPFSIDAVYSALDQAAARRLCELDGVRAVYAYDRGALHVFQAASSARIRRIYELPTPHWRFAARLLREELELQPEWAMTMPDPRADSVLQQRRQRELDLADLVIVPSRFVQRTLQESGFQGAADIVPYGSPPQPRKRPSKKASGKLRVLYVGALSQCKGLAYLLEAVKPLNRAVDLTLIGRGNTGCPALAQAVRTYRWVPSIPHSELLEEMRLHDVLVLPSLFDGFGLVIAEALSRGLPVVATTNTAGPELLSEGADGFVVPIRSPRAIAEKLELLAKDRELLAFMGANAQAKAASCGWQRYRAHLVAVVGHAAGPATARASLNIASHS